MLDILFWFCALETEYELEEEQYYDEEFEYNDPDQ
jgi:hypothetical protein|tara:strand:+ start:5063 stop:5167 length:105 start_codon:yes stop_codon:yes gene_type:complete